MKDIDAIIRARKTSKVLGDPNHSFESDLTKNDLEQLISTAGYAPFHYPCHKTHRENRLCDSLVPWRFYALDGKACRQLLNWLQKENLMEGKIPQLLAAADALIQVTWLPDPSDDPLSQLFVPSIRNMEHIAGASAAIQNLLLASTAKNYATYWSSGGVLREKLVFEQLSMPSIEILLGSVFVFNSIHDTAEVKPGKLRSLRGEVETWLSWVTLE